MNLRAAADDVGVRQAIRPLGNLRGLALGYLQAEYGDATLRPSWTAAATTLLLIDGAMLAISAVTTAVFRAGVTAVDPQATGTFHWHGLPYLLADQRLRFVDGRSTVDGGAWTPTVYLLLVLGAVLAGRLWRLFPALRRRYAEAL